MRAGVAPRCAERARGRRRDQGAGRRPQPAADDALPAGAADAAGGHQRSRRSSGDRRAPQGRPHRRRARPTAICSSRAILRERFPLVIEATETIGDLQVRNRGTVGGSLAHADPASDLPAVMLVLDATFNLRSKRGKRSVAAREFFQGAFTTALAEDEMLIDIVLPRDCRRARAPRTSARTSRHRDSSLAGAAAWSPESGRR